MDLEAIPGVGEKTAAALRELDDPEAALERGDVAELASAPGLSAGKAARIARAAIRERHGETGEFLATDRARELHREVLERLQDRAVTEYGRKRLETFYPSTADSRIEEVRAFVADAMDREPVPAVGEALEDVDPLETPPEGDVHDRCLATTDAGTYSAAREAIPEVSVEIVEDARDLAELARGYSTVIALDAAFAGVEIEGDIRVEPDALDRPAEVVPERVLDFFAANRDRLRAAIAVHRAAGMDPPCDVDALEGALDRLDPDGGVAGDDELDRLARAAADVDAVAASAADAATERLREAIRERDVTIEGGDLLSLAEQGAGVGSILESELGDAFEAAIADARAEVVETLALTDREAERARRAFPEDPTFPVAYDEEVIARLREELTKARDRRAGRLKRDLAADLAEARGDAEALIRAALERDVERAVARFARDFECILPELDGDGFSIEGGRCFLLDEPFAAIEPVDYAVEGVVVLSGVNSGGKTSTLDLIGTVAVLAHMGLPVPAEHARIERFEALHYFTKSSGTLDAGAFEATVQEFGDLVEGAGDRLVLVDELESITEPGASARIIAGILETLAEEGATAVFVSHLAEEVREAADCALTVDGIEAEGLIDGELRIDRSPVKGHLARSMPELIVEKLVGEEDADFYRRLLGKFEDR
jgi:dsDNA-specific endonuclease/ATPase MutS2